MLKGSLALLICVIAAATAALIWPREVIPQTRRIGHQSDNRTSVEYLNPYPRSTIPPNVTTDVDDDAHGQESSAGERLSPRTDLDEIFSGDRSKIRNVLRGFLDRPLNSEEDADFGEFLGALPTEVASELVVNIHQMSGVRQLATVAAFGDMLMHKPQGPDDAPELSAASRVVVRNLLETQTVSNTNLRGAAFESLLGTGGSKSPLDNDLRLRTYSRFLELSATEKNSLFPEELTGVDPNSFWTRKATEYAFALGDGQRDAISRLLGSVHKDAKGVAIVNDVLLTELRVREVALTRGSTREPFAEDDISLTKESSDFLRPKFMKLGASGGGGK